MHRKYRYNRFPPPNMKAKKKCLTREENPYRWDRYYSDDIHFVKTMGATSPVTIT